jgi:hypothetical protein
MQSIPVTTTREGTLAITCRVLKSSGCLAFLLLFLLAAVSTASAVTTLTPGTISASASPTYGTTVTLSSALTGWVSGAAGTITFSYGTASSGPYTTAFAAGTCSTAVTAAATNSCTITGIAAGTYYVKAVYTTPNTTTYASPTTSAAFTLTVAKALLTVTAPTLTEPYGTAVPTITPTYATFKNGDTALVSPGTCSTTYTSTSAVGVTQTTSCTGNSDPNYTITNTPGTVTVTKATPTVTWAAPAAISYPTALSATQLNASMNAPGSCVYSPVSGTVLLYSASPQTLTVTCTPSDLTSYNLPSPASSTVSLTVNKGTSTVTWANPTGISYGTLLSATQLNASLSVPGACTYASNPVGTQLAAGTQTLAATCTPTDPANYTTPAVKNATLIVSPTLLTVTAPSFVLAANAPVPSSLTPVYTGFLNSDTAATSGVVTTPASCSTTYAGTGTGSASFPVTCSGEVVSANYTTSNVAGAITFGAATTTTLKIGLTTSSDTSIPSAAAGTSVTLTAIVSGTGAAGTVNFTYVDPISLKTLSIPGCGSIQVHSAYAFCTTNQLPVSTNELLVATFSGANFATSYNAIPLPFAVTQTTTTTTLAVTAVSAGTTSSVVYGASVTLTATVTGTGASGAVTFTYGQSPIIPIPNCIALPLAAGAGTVTCTTTALPVSGNEKLNAYFSNATNAFTTSSPTSPLSFAVTQTTPTTTLAVTAVSAGTTTSVVYGTSVTLTATVTTGATGTVAFTYGSGTPIVGCTAQTLTVAQTTTATCTTTTLPVATAENLIAAFTSNSSNYASSNSSAPTFAVTVNAPTITLSAPTTSTYGTSVALGVTGLPLGAGALGSGDTLAFTYTGKASGAVTCTNVVTISAAGAATCNTIMLPAQANSVVATFTPGTAMAVNTGAGPFSNATKPTVTVGAATTSVSLATSPSGTTYLGATVTLTATLPSAADYGTVTFTYGVSLAKATTTLGCSAVPVTGTTATCVTTALPSAPSSAPNVLLATFTPTTAANFTTATATSTQNLIVIGAVSTTTAVTVPAATNYYGVNPALTATVSCNSATCTAAAGTVTFFNNGVSIGNGTALVASGTGTSTLTPTVPLPVGTNQITATFNSNDTSTVGYSNSTSLIVPVTVVATPTTPVIYAFGNGAITQPSSLPSTSTGSALPSKIQAGIGSFTLYATIAPALGTAAINGGNVSFYDVSSAGSTLLGRSSITTVNGVATAQLQINCAVAATTPTPCSGPLSLGTRHFTANYGGVYNGTGAAQFAASVSDSVSVVVQGVPVLTITASSPTVVMGSAVPVITPLYTISNGGPVAADAPYCTATANVDANGISIFSCTSLVSAGNKPPVCTTTYTTTTAPTDAAPTTTCSGAKNGNYTIAPYVPGTVTVTGIAPTWSSFNAQELTYGSAYTFAAHVNSGGTITYAISKNLGCVKGATTTTDVNGASCTLTPLTGGIVSATTWPGTYYVTASVTANGNYAAASTQRTVMVNAATPIVKWSEPTAIQYGAFLSTSNFPTCSATYLPPLPAIQNTKTITGTCAWASHAQGASSEPGANTPSVGSFQTAIFKPSASYGNGTVNGYNSVVTNLVANVTPISATITTNPTATSIASGSAVYANSANVSKISGGIAKTSSSGTVLSGTWSWTCSLNGNTCTPITTFPASVSVTFTPSSVNYAATSVIINVAQLTPTVVTQWPTASAITYGQALSSSALDSSSAVVTGGFTGKFTWANPSFVPTSVGAAQNECVIFTVTSVATQAPVYSNGPAPCTTGGTGPTNVTVDVNQGTPTVNWSAVPAPTTYSGLALSTALFSLTDTAADPYTGEVAGLFSWDSASAASIFPPIGTSTYLADFTATTSADYAVTKGQVSVTVNPCGLQDSKNSVYAVADYVDTDIAGGISQIANASFPLTLSGVSNESVFCAVNSGPTVTTVVPSIATPQITLTSASTNFADSLSNGANAAVLAYGTNTTATKGATITITDGGTTHASDGAAGSITTNSDYSSGVFASMGGAVDITNTSIATSGVYSSALGATNQGTLSIYNVTAATSGQNSSAIMTGVGGGQVTVNGGSYSNNYSTAGTTIATPIYAAGTCTNSDGTACTNTTISGQAHPWSTVTVNDGSNNGTTIGATITAVNGPAVVVEGGNKVLITSAGLTSLTGALGNNQGILLYQSGSLTDATPATTAHPTIFSMTGGSLTYNCDANSVPFCGTGANLAKDQNTESTVFSVTNTTATINLTDVTLYNNTNSNGDGNLLTAAKLSTGPATVNFNLTGETVTGDVIVDALSTVNMTLAGDSANPNPIWTGTFANGIYPTSAGTLGTVSLTLDAASTWIVTTPTVTLNSLTDATANFSNIVCAANPSCTVTITNPTLGQPSSFSPASN